MNDFIKLTKINLKSFFTTSKFFYDQKTNKRKTGKILLIIYVVLILGFYVYNFANMTMKGYMALNIPYVLLAEFMAISSMTLLTTNLYKIKGTLFGFKDYDLLMSLPIDKKVVILSKIFILYLTNLLYLFMFMIPSFIVYVRYVQSSVIFYILFFITLFIIPLVPIILSTIIGTIITGVSSKFKKSNLINIILTIGYLALIMYITSATGTGNSIDFANIGESMVNVFNKVYPLTRIYIDIIKDSSILSAILFVLIPVALFTLFVFVVEKFYVTINANIIKKYTNSKFKLKKYKSSSQLKSLYKKEFKRFTSSVNYIMNCSIGAILLLLFSVAIPFAGAEKVSALLNMPEITNLLGVFTPLLISIFCSLTCTTFASISLEGKNFSILKTLPVNPITIFMSKVLVNLTILIPSIVISATILCISLKLSLVTYLLSLLIPFVYAIFISFMGLIYNLLFPNFNWTNEIRVIKQSLASLLTIITGLIMTITPLIINEKIKLSNNTFMISLIVLMSIICLVEYYYLKTYGTKRFNKIG